MNKLLLGLLATVVLLGVTCLPAGRAFSVAHAEVVFPERPTGFVNDVAEVLSAEVQAALDAELSEFEKETGNEVAILTIPTIMEYSVEEYAVRIFEKWGIGKANEDNGILFLVVVDDRKVKIEVGYGLEGVITDGTAGAILDAEVVPWFREGNYETGIVAGTDEIVRILRGGTPPVSSSADEGEDLAGVFGFFFVFLLNTAFVSIGYMARTKSFWFGGIFGAVIGFFFSLAFGYFAIFVPAYALAGLVLDYLLSRYASHWTNGRGGGPGSFWTGGGGFGGGSSSGGGFGGFGGGSSGGGGASRSW